MDTTITLPAGGKLHASRSHLCLAFEKTRFSLSTAIYGGGFKEINYAVNQKLETFYPSEDRFPGGSVSEFLRLSGKGLRPSYSGKDGMAFRENIFP